MAGEAVAAGAPDLLVVRLQRARNVEVGHEPDVRLVDAHAERVGGYNDRRVPAHEAFLRRRPVRVRHPRVVTDGVDAGRAQGAHHLLHVLARGGIDDARSAGARERDQPPQLVLVAGDPQDLDEEVGAIEPGDEHLGVAQLERVGDVAAHFRRGRCRQRQHPFRRQRFARPRELLVFGAEIVSPRGDAVRLVDRQQGHPHSSHGGEERGRLEPLWRDVDQAVFASPHRRLPFLALGIRQRAVDEGGGNPPGPQRVHLVLHQRHQRRDHHRGALQQQRRKLVAERLSPAGGKDGDGGPAREHRPDNGLLSLAERLVPEMLLQRLDQLHLPSPYPTPSRGTSETGGHRPSTALCTPDCASTR